MERHRDGRPVGDHHRPEAHAASLLRQHRNFLDLQQRDDFIRRYMRDIGQFEFGQIHKPLLFEGFDPGAHDPLTLDYWLAYWISAFREVLRHEDRCLFVLQDDLRAAPQATMQRLCEALGVEAAEVSFEGYFLGEADAGASEGFSAELLAEAGAVYGRLDICGRSDRNCFHVFRQWEFRCRIDRRPWFHHEMPDELF